MQTIPHFKFQLKITISILIRFPAFISEYAECMARLRGRATGTDMAEALLKRSKRCRALPDKDKCSADEILGYGAAGMPE